MYGDMLATAAPFIKTGHIIDMATDRMLIDLVNQYAGRWQRQDSGIWELPKQQHYIHSKIAYWLALDHAVALVRDGHPESTWQERWQRKRDRISEWVENRCWSDAKRAYTFYPASNKLDAAVTLMHTYGAGINRPRMLATYTVMTEVFDNLCDNSNIKTLNEIFDVNTGLWRGNLPQGLSYLALIFAPATLSHQTIPPYRHVEATRDHGR